MQITNDISKSSVVNTDETMKKSKDILEEVLDLSNPDKVLTEEEGF